MINLKELKEFVVAKLKNELSDQLTYHNLQHTMDVWVAAQLLAEHENLPKNDRHEIEAAALFHDMGFIDQYLKNEPIGADYARKYLPDFGFSQDQIKEVERLIIATAYPGKPLDLKEAILCDADLSYLGRDTIEENTEQLYQEFVDQGLIQSRKDWLKLQVTFLENHQFHTESARLLWDEQLKINLDQAKENYAVYENTLPPTE